MTNSHMPSMQPRRGRRLSAKGFVQRDDGVVIDCRDKIRHDSKSSEGPDSGQLNPLVSEDRHLSGAKQVRAKLTDNHGRTLGVTVIESHFVRWR
jgi:hypothetical protein